MFKENHSYFSRISSYIILSNNFKVNVTWFYIYFYVCMYVCMCILMPVYIYIFFNVCM